MNPKEFFTRRAAAIKDADYRRVALIMCDHIGEENAVRKEVVQARAGLGNERDVRGMFEVLTTVYHFPICSHSGKAGYFVPPMKSAASRTRAEIRSRGEKMFAKDRAYDECEYPPEDAEVHQPTAYMEQNALFDMPDPKVDQLAYWRR